MPTVTVNSSVSAGTNNIIPVPYAVQRWFRGSSTSTSKNTMAGQLAAAGCNAMVYHWSGGGTNGTTGSQQWSTSDFAPTAAGARVWSDSGGYRGMDTMFADLDRLRAFNPNAKIVLVMHDHPGSMILNGGGTVRTSNRNNYPWPAPSVWGGDNGDAGDLCSEIIARYGQDKILAFSYGQELKGITPNRTDTTALNNFAAGFTAWATYMRANHPTCELWYPHINYWATHTSLTNRRNAMDAIIAGGSTLEANDEIIINRLMDQVDPDLVDRMTYDCSIIDNSGSDTWRSDYSSVKQRATMEYHLVRVLKEKMTSRWGAQKPLVAIESYFDVNQTEQDWANNPSGKNANPSSALSTAIYMSAMRAGTTLHARWEPQRGDIANEAPDGNIASWFDPDASEWPAWQNIEAIMAAIPEGTALIQSSSDDADIHAVASATKTVVQNLKTTSSSVTVVNGSNSSSTVSIPAYSVYVFDTPAGDPGGGETLVPNVVQSKGAFVARSAASISVTLDNPVTPGNYILVLAAANENAAGINPVVWNASALTGFDELLVSRPLAATTHQYMGAWKKVAAGGEQTFTLSETDNDAVNHPALNMHVLEIENLSGALHATIGENGATSGTTADTDSVVTTMDNVFAVAWIVNKNIYAQNVDSSPDGFTTAAGIANETGTASGQRQTVGCYYKVVSPEGTVQARRDLASSISNSSYIILLEPAIDMGEEEMQEFWGVIPIF